VRETEVLINKLTEQVSDTTQVVRPSHANSPLLRNVEDRLRSSFQTKVQVKGDFTRGKIEVQYFSEDELNRLLEMWNIRID
jgi:ParB family chromosome partitioning protein